MNDEKETAATNPIYRYLAKASFVNGVVVYGNHDLSECIICGSIVSNKETHTEWHKKETL